MLKLFFAINLFSIVAMANVDRIQSLRFDRGNVQTIYLAPGLGSMILFPCALLEAFIGRSEDLKSQISPNDKKVLFLNLKLNSSLPTNVIARCENEKNAFVFDVIPSRAKHQDVVEIRSSFGSPINRSLQTQKPTKTLPNKHVIEKPIQIIEGTK